METQWVQSLTKSHPAARGQPRLCHPSGPSTVTATGKAPGSEVSGFFLREAGTRQGVEAQSRKSRGDAELRRGGGDKAGPGAPGGTRPRRTRLPLPSPAHQTPGRVTARKRRKGTQTTPNPRGKHLCSSWEPPAEEEATHPRGHILSQHGSDFLPLHFSNSPKKWDGGKATVFFQVYKYKQNPERLP